MTQVNENPARLIVLLPENLAGDVEFARKINGMAGRAQKDVIYLTLLDDPDQRLSVVRGLVTMKAVTESNLIHVGSMQVAAAQWYARLREIWRPGDTVVCHAEQTVNQGFLRAMPLGEYLLKNLGGEIETVNGYYHPHWQQMVRWIRSASFWVGALAILAGFTWLEFQADAAFPGFAHNLVLVVILLIEFGAVWAWSLLNRR